MGLLEFEVTWACLLLLRLIRLLLLIYPTDSAPGPFPGWSFGWSTKQIYCLGLNPAAGKRVHTSRFWVMFENYKKCKTISLPHAVGVFFMLPNPHECHMIVTRLRFYAWVHQKNLRTPPSWCCLVCICGFFLVHGLMDPGPRAHPVDRVSLKRKLLN
jgi:hypothetical protein